MRWTKCCQPLPLRDVRIKNTGRKGLYRRVEGRPDPKLSLEWVAQAAA
jgi:hypothetical protein